MLQNSYLPGICRAAVRIFWCFSGCFVSCKVRGGQPLETPCPREVSMCGGCDLRGALYFPCFSFSWGTIFPSSEVFNTNLLGLHQPLPNFAIKMSTEGVMLCKGIQGSTNDLLSLSGEGSGEDFLEDFFVALPAVSLPKNPQKNLRQNPHRNPHTKIRTKKSSPKNPHQEILTKKSHLKILTRKSAPKKSSPKILTALRFREVPHDLSQLEA